MIQQHTEELITQYLLHCKFQKGLSEKTLKAYKIDLKQFSVFVGEQVFSKELLQDYVTILFKQYKIKSVKRKIASLKSFFNYLEYEEILVTNPFKKLRIKLHEPFILPRTIPLNTIDLLLKYAYQRKTLAITVYQYRTCLRDIAVLELLFATGMRISELCSIKPDCINLEDGTIKIYGKGAKERILQIGNTDVLAAVREYGEAFSNTIGSSNCFFVNRLGHQLSDQSIRNMINQYADLAGIGQHITPHMFRHSFATLLLEEDVDIRYIQQLLGHSAITTIGSYTHVTLNKQRDILTTKHPRNKIKV